MDSADHVEAVRQLYMMAPRASPRLTPKTAGQESADLLGRRSFPAGEREVEPVLGAGEGHNLKLLPLQTLNPNPQPLYQLSEGRNLNPQFSNF